MCLIWNVGDAAHGSKQECSWRVTCDQVWPDRAKDTEQHILEEVGAKPVHRVRRPAIIPSRWERARPAGRRHVLSSYWPTYRRLSDSCRPSPSRWRGGNMPQGWSIFLQENKSLLATATLNTARKKRRNADMQIQSEFTEIKCEFPRKSEAVHEVEDPLDEERIVLKWFKSAALQAAFKSK